MRKTLRNRLLVRFFLVIALFTSGVVLTLFIVDEVGGRTKLLIDRYWQDNNLIAQVNNLLGEVTLFLDLPPGHPEASSTLRQLQTGIDALIGQIAVSTFREDFRKHQVAELRQLKINLGASAEILGRIEQKNREADALLKLLTDEAERLGQRELVFGLNIAALAYRDFRTTENPSDLEIFRQQIARIASHNIHPGLANSFAAFRQSGEMVFTRRLELRESRGRIVAQIKALSASMRERTELYTQSTVVPARKKIEEGLASIPDILLTALVLGGLLALGTSILFAQRISIPLEKAAIALARIEKGDLEARVDPSGDDEINLIGRAINSLAISLSQTLDHLHATVKRLQQSEEQYRQIAEQRLELERIINASPTIAFLCHATENFPVVYMSQSVDQFGFQARAFRGGSLAILQLIHPEDRERVAAAFNKCLGDTKIQESFVEFRIRTASGETHWVDCRLRAQRDVTGAATHLQGVLLDITEKVRLREQAAQASRLASLGELAAGVAHEINNPNATILLNAAVLKDLAEGMLRLLDDLWKERGELDLGRIPYARLRTEIPRLQAEVLEASGRIRRIVEDLREFARSDPPELLQTVDVNAVVQAAVRLTGNAVKKATDHFTADYCVDLPPIRGHAQRLEQVVINLLMNAAQALSDRQRGLFVKTAMTEAENAICLTVRDEGVGIPATHLPHVTDPFFTTRREQGGTGLGLSVSARIIKEHGGRLEIDSPPGAGTEMRVILPLAAEEPDS
ncbi:MAG: PAS domain S-box protein [Desulfuromonas sp.]|nr:PAS domain S-box protein [Desulfuromonas sp.]